MNGLRSAHLTRCAVFHDISEEMIEGLRSHGRIVSFAEGHGLFERGQPADELLILQEGVVELFFPVRIMGATRELTMESKQPGDVVAWSSLVSPYRFTLSARCASKCTLLGFHREAVQAFFEANPHAGYLFMRNLAGVIGRRLQAMQTIWMHDIQASTAKHMG